MTQILRCRWILNWKPLDPSDHAANQGRTHKAKARIVVLGYMDPQIEEIPRDSPTLSRTSRMLILQLIASHSWKLQSFDIKAAFLQGQPQENRLIAVDPVNELREALKLNPNEITRFKQKCLRFNRCSIPLVLCTCPRVNTVGNGGLSV